MTPDDKSELNAGQIAQEFNRRKWRGREDWRVGQRTIFLIPISASAEYDIEIDINDARALLAGWQAMEEIAALNAQLDAEIKYADSLSTQLTALTAENERLKSELEIRSLDRAVQLCEAADKAIERLERLREPAEGIGALARRITDNLAVEETCFGVHACEDVFCEHWREGAGKIIAAELRKGIAPAEGTWGWAIGQVGKTVQRGQGPETVKVFISEHCGLFLDGCKGALTRADYESTDWQIADEGSES